MNCHNSGPHPPVFELEGLEISIAERYPAVAHWNIPKHPGFNTYAARLQSFDCGRPHERPDLRLKSAAGIFYTGTDLTPTLTIVQITRTRISSYLPFTLLLKLWRQNQCFYCGCWLGRRAKVDDPFSQHKIWYPNSGFVHYVQRRNVQPTNWGCPCTLM
jgi:hypothetical protein